VLSAAVFVGVVGFLVQMPAIGPARGWPGELTALLGRALMGPYVMPFELLAVLLVIALLGALYFARSDT
jgi:NADH:ubiquinone oxidoreductase subunit 6 (subunit J)